MKATHNCLTAWTIETFTGCSNSALTAATLHAATVTQEVNTSPHPFAPKMRQEHPQGTRAMMVSARCRTCICHPIKSRPDLYETGTGTTCLESKAYSAEAFRSSGLLGYSSDRKNGSNFTKRCPVKLALVSFYYRERSENLGFLFKNIWKPLYFEKAACYLVPACRTAWYRSFTATASHGTRQILPSENSIRCPHLLLWEALVQMQKTSTVTRIRSSVSAAPLMNAARSMWIKNKLQLFAKGFWPGVTAVPRGFFWSLHKDHKPYWSV